MLTDSSIAVSSAASTALVDFASTPEASATWAARLDLLKAVLMGFAAAAGAAFAGAALTAFAGAAAFFAAFTGAAALVAFLAGAGVFFAVAMVLTYLDVYAATGCYGAAIVGGARVSRVRGPARGFAEPACSMRKHRCPPHSF